MKRLSEMSDRELGDEARRITCERTRCIRDETALHRECKLRGLVLTDDGVERIHRERF